MHKLSKKQTTLKPKTEENKQFNNENAYIRTVSSSSVGFNVLPNTLKVISGTIFYGLDDQPTVSSTEGQHLVSAPGKGPIPLGQALYKVKWSKYNFLKHLHSTIKSEDTEVLGGLKI